MKLNQNMVIGALLTAVLVGPSLAHAEWDGPRHGDKAFKEKMKEHRLEMQKELGLTKEQQEKLDANRKAQKEQMQVLRKTKQEKMEALRQELQKEQMEEAKINQLNGEIKQLQSQLSDLRINSVMEVRKILTPEQFKKFNAKMEKRRHEMKEKMKDKVGMHEEGGWDRE